MGDEALEADAVVWACGGWLADLFPGLVTVTTTHQDLFFIDGGEPWAQAPGWVDYDGAVYGTGDLDGLGVKGAPDFEGPPLAPEDDLPPTNPDNERWIRDYFARRFPALAEAPLKCSTSCRYELSPTRTSSPPRTPSTRRCGWSAAAPATASSTARRWRRSWPRRCAAASRCPSASGSASVRRAVDAHVGFRSLTPGYFPVQCAPRSSPSPSCSPPRPPPLRRTRSSSRPASRRRGPTTRPASPRRTTRTR